MSDAITWAVLVGALVLAAIGFEIWGSDSTAEPTPQRCYQTRDGTDCYDLER